MRRWDDEARRVGGELARVERELFDRFNGILTDSARRVVGNVLGPGFTVDANGVYAMAGDYLPAMREFVQEDLRGVAEEAHGRREVVPGARTLIEDYLRNAENRLVGVPDRVYARVKALVGEATRDGWENERLAARIEELLTGEGVDTWAGRSMVIARTEAIAAYNAGTLAGFFSAAVAEGAEFDKAWLATEDDRTRPSHVRADGQRVALAAPFRVGRSELMFPGDPSGPPHEVIQCRCSMLMLEPGEEVDMTGRGFTDPDDWSGWDD